MNINDEMASYMISALDESSSTQDFMISHFGGSTYKEILARLDLDLNETIARQNMTDLLQLFHAVAIKWGLILNEVDDLKPFFLQLWRLSIPLRRSQSTLLHRELIIEERNT